MYDPYLLPTHLPKLQPHLPRHPAQRIELDLGQQVHFAHPNTAHATIVPFIHCFVLLGIALILGHVHAQRRKPFVQLGQILFDGKGEAMAKHFGGGLIQHAVGRVHAAPSGHDRGGRYRRYTVWVVKPTKEIFGVDPVKEPQQFTSGGIVATGHTHPPVPTRREKDVECKAEQDKAQRLHFWSVATGAGRVFVVGGVLVLPRFFFVLGGQASTHARGGGG